MKNKDKEALKAIINLAIFVILFIFIVYKIYGLEKAYKYKVEVDRVTYYTNIEPKVYNLGKCIEINSFDERVLNFCDSKFLVRQ